MSARKWPALPTASAEAPSVFIDVACASGQPAISAFMAGLEGQDGPTYYTYPLLLQYLAQPPSKAGLLGGDFGDTLGAVTKKLLALAGGEVYLAEGRAYERAALAAEYPELALFRIGLAEAFAESPRAPGVWVETQRFADLRVLSRMRREIQRTGVASGLKAVEVVKALLGLEVLCQQ